MVARRYAARTDTNHAAVVKSLRAQGWSVLDLSRVGQGCPDLLCARNGETVLVEVKRPPTVTVRKDGYERHEKAGALRASQLEFRASWRGRIVTVTTDADVDALGERL